MHHASENPRLATFTNEVPCALRAQIYILIAHCIASHRTAHFPSLALSSSANKARVCVREIEKDVLFTPRSEERSRSDKKTSFANTVIVYALLEINYTN